MKVFVLFIIFGLIFSILILFRNNRVFNYRVTLNDRCHHICISDIGKDLFEQRDIDVKMWNDIMSIPYEEMLYKFWKPLNDNAWLSDEQLTFIKRADAP